MTKKNPNALLAKLSPSTNELLGRDVSAIEQRFVDHLEFSLAKDRYSATRLDYLKSIIYTVRDHLFERWIETQQTYYNKDAKRIYYLSMEFMMGRLLTSALISRDLTESVATAIWNLGLNLEELEEAECDFGLGNGGLGRLAACFLDSMATLELPAYGYGIRYEYGIFSQKIQDGYQVERPDQWLRYGNPWEIERPEFSYQVKFYGRVEQSGTTGGGEAFSWVYTDDVTAMAYDVPVPGYNNNTVNNLRLWSAKASEDFNLDYFNHGNYEKAVQDKIESEVISKVLYPRDDFIQGRELRLKQEYFMSSATLQDIIRRFKKAHRSFTSFPEKVAIQLNDTHPVLSIPELMRLLVDNEKIPWEKAWEITTNTFAYTNHTVLQEALETWRMSLMEKMLPRHVQIIFEINKRFLNDIRIRFPGDEERVRKMSVIDEGTEKRVRMANLAIVGSHSVNGVARLHTSILKEQLFSDFFTYWPQKFNCKTNGITQRRWLLQCNPPLARLITETIGDQWITDLDALHSLLEYSESEKMISNWQEVRQINKKRFAAFIKDNFRQEINIHGIIDSQIKRIHEYKRQLLNVLHIISLYEKIKSGNDNSFIPRTFLFAGKAAPAYQRAKLIIKLINAVGEKINNDSRVGDRLRVLFLPDYSVSLAQRIIPATDLSEQISTAGMEASGTGNMKFALNGSLTIGTLDGANIEIKEEVGDDNIFIFGLTDREVLQRRQEGYHPGEIVAADEDLKHILNLIRDNYFSDSEPGIFAPIVDDLLSGDYYMVIADYADYLRTQEKVNLLYRNQQLWTTKSIINTASMGRFSSDRTIKEYAEEIWHAKQIPIKLLKESEYSM
jgi:starch phosphorylase